MKTNWQTKNIEDCIEKIIYTNKIQRKFFLESGIFPVISQEQDLINGYWNKKEDVFHVSRPVVVFGDHTQILKYVDFDFVLGADGVKLLQPKEFLYPKYFYYFLQSINLRSLGYARHYRLLKEKAISYPESISEQKRIVKILDESFEKLEKARLNAEKNLQNSKELFESYLLNIFKEPKKDWHICNLEEFIKLIDYRGRTPVKTESGVRLITAKNVKLGYLQLEPQEFIASDNYDSWMTRGIPNFGDVIFTTEAPLANVAQIDTNGKVAFAQRIIVMQPDRKMLDQTFLKYLLLSKPIRNKILEKGTGATVQGIKSSLLKKVSIYFPNSLDEQKTIVKKLDQLSEQTKKLESIYQTKLSAIEELKKSILSKAFSKGL